MTVSDRGRRLAPGLACVLGLSIGLASISLATAPATSLAAGSNEVPPAAAPVAFEPNLGQFDPAVLYAARTGGLTLFLTRTGAVAVLAAPGAPRDGSPVVPVGKSPDAGRTVDATAVFIDLPGLSAGSVTAESAAPGQVNYFLGNDPSGWRNHVPRFNQVRYAGAYPGTDLVFHLNGGRLEYDLELAPGADPGIPAMRFRGQSSVLLDAAGDLELETPTGSLSLAAPSASQAGARVASSFTQLGAATFGFRLGTYDHARPLVIDPLLFSTLTGPGYQVAVAVDSLGDVVVTGYEYLAGYPTSPGAFQRANAGQDDVYVTELDPTGTTLRFSTLIGGSDYDYASGVAIGPGNDVFVSAYVWSNNYPVTAGAFQTAHVTPNSVGAVTRLAHTGDHLVYSTYLGTTYSLDSVYEYLQAIAVDAAGDAYVTGLLGGPTTPPTQPHFPVTAGAYDTNYNSSEAMAFVTEIASSGASLVYSTYLGGTTLEYGIDIAIDGAGNAYVTGYTGSTDFPTTAGAPQTFKRSQPNYLDAFAAEISAGGATLGWGTYLGADYTNVGEGIAVDASGTAFVTGYAWGNSYPTSPGAFQTAPGGNEDVFLSAIRAGGTSFQYSTLVGGSGTDIGTSVALDSAGRAYVGGESTSTDLPMAASGWGVTHQKSGGEDGFVIGFSNNGSALFQSTWLGGSGDDLINSIAFDGSGDLLATGYEGSADFPLTAGSYSTGHGPAFVAKIQACLGPALPGVPRSVTASAGNGTLTIAWQAPDCDGGLPFSRYDISVSPLSGTLIPAAPASTINLSVAGNVTTASVRGLVIDCHTRYSATITAVNSDGSSPSAATPPLRTSGYVAAATAPARVIVVVDGEGSGHDAESFDPLAPNVRDGSGAGSPTYCPESGLGVRTRYIDAGYDEFNSSWNLGYPAPSAPAGVAAPVLTGDGSTLTHRYLLDLLAGNGALVLPFSYTGATLSGNASNPIFTSRLYGPGNSSDGDFENAAYTLEQELSSINSVWPSAEIDLVGFGQGGLVSELFWEQLRPLDPTGNSFGVRYVFTLDGTINGTQQVPPCAPSLNTGPCTVNTEYLALWNARPARDVLINAVQNGRFIPIGTTGDPVYEAADGGRPGICSQLIFFGAGCTPAQPVAPSHVSGCAITPASPASFRDQSGNGPYLVRFCPEVASFIDRTLLGAATTTQSLPGG
ncbi:MAG: DUF7948 domain-containing protein [Candidatus Dormibacteria bacterium]